jgi:hypothetical protein
MDKLIYGLDLENQMFKILIHNLLSFTLKSFIYLYNQLYYINIFIDIM